MDIAPPKQMATLEKIHYTPFKLECTETGIQRIPDPENAIVGLPQIVWADQTPWREANLWALEQAGKGAESKTTMSCITHLHAYAKWLESQKVDWWHFPAREADRCLTRFRGSVVAARDNGELAPSTASQRISAVIRFYKWLAASRLLSADWPMWTDKQVGIRLIDEFGFARTMMVSTTNLAIPNRKAPGEKLEDGLLPLSLKDAHAVIQAAKDHGNYELYLMLKIGFGTGMRIGTICDLRIATIQRAVPDPTFPGFHKLAVGPGAHPRVHTKFGVTGQVWISDEDLQLLRDYMFSPKRLKRQAKAKEGNRDIVFLSKDGNAYGEGDGNASRGISVQLGRLRKEGLINGITAFRGFRFHQSRCTFATELARVAMKMGTVGMAVQLVRQALLHKSEKTTLTYIRFIEKTDAMSGMADAFTRDFLGLGGSEKLSNA